MAAPPSDTSGTANGVNLTARWWQVALTDLSFFADSTTGGNCRVVDLPSGTLVMVAGTLGGASGERACDIPSGATVVLPVLNNLYALTEPAPVDTVGLARRINRTAVAGAQVEATVDGEPATVRRIRSSRFTIDGEVFGYPRLLPAVSDGHWLVLTPEDGVHEVTTTGVVPSTGFASSTSYTFTVG